MNPVTITCEQTLLDMFDLSRRVNYVYLMFLCIIIEKHLVNNLLATQGPSKWVPSKYFKILLL